MPRKRRAALTDEPSTSRVELDQHIADALDDLRRRIKAIRGSFGHMTMSATDVLHEVWLKLATSTSPAVTSRAHFIALAAKTSRQVLVDAARARMAEKRPGGSGRLRVPLDDADRPVVHAPEQMIALHEALEQLEAADPAQAALVEQRYFCGLTVIELAEITGVSESTIERDLRSAMVWLRAQLKSI